jgi:hypothetical protein
MTDRTERAPLPRIPPPPPQEERRRRGSDGRWLLWAGVFAIGAALGAGAYQWAPNFDAYVDEWVALALG